MTQDLTPEPAELPAFGTPDGGSSQALAALSVSAEGPTTSKKFMLYALENGDFVVDLETHEHGEEVISNLIGFADQSLFMLRDLLGRAEELQEVVRTYQNGGMQ